MILLERPAMEPEALRAARDTHLPRLRALVAQQPDGALRPPERTQYEGYRVALAALRAVAGDKCWYCEKRFEGKQEPVEHYRPKQRAHRGEGLPRDGYWWLAWTWSNLMLVCADCNTAKGTGFPLARGCTPLRPEEQPPGTERPLLIDPCCIDPLEHLAFVEAPHDRWIARAVGGSPLGQTTIEQLGLDGVRRPGVLDLRRTHVSLVVRPRVNGLRELLRRGDAREISEAWRSTCRALLRHAAPYAALSYCVLRAKISEAERTRWRLELPRPRKDWGAVLVPP